MIKKGVITALITPFDKNNKVDYLKYKKLIESQINANITGIVCNSTTGERLTLDKFEREKILKFAIKCAKDNLQIFASVGSSSTKETLKEIKQINKYNISGILLNMPCANKPNESGLYKHVELCANASKHPIIIYNVPARTGLHLSLKQINCFANFKNIAGIKEASTSLEYFSKCVNIKNDFLVFSGNDDLFAESLCLGGAGIISVASNIIPEQMMQIYKLYAQNKTKQCLELYYKYLPFLQSLFLETNPAPIKFAFKAIGNDMGNTRLPLGELNLINKSIIRDEIVKIKNAIF